MFKKISLVLVMSILIFGPKMALAGNSLQRIRNDAKTQLNQLPSTKPEDVLGLAIKAMMMFMGAIMFMFVVYGGFLWMTASGNQDQITKAKNIIVWSALGVTVMLLSYVIVNFIFEQLKETDV